MPLTFQHLESVPPQALLQFRQIKKAKAYESLEKRGNASRTQGANRSLNGQPARGMQDPCHLLECQIRIVEQVQGPAAIDRWESASYKREPKGAAVHQQDILQTFAPQQTLGMPKHRPGKIQPDNQATGAASQRACEDPRAAGQIEQAFFPTFLLKPEDCLNLLIERSGAGKQIPAAPPKLLVYGNYKRRLHDALEWCDDFNRIVADHIQNSIPQRIPGFTRPAGYATVIGEQVRSCTPWAAHIGKDIVQHG